MYPELLVNIINVVINTLYIQFFSWLNIHVLDFKLCKPKNQKMTFLQLVLPECIQSEYALHAHVTDKIEIIIF